MSEKGVGEERAPKAALKAGNRQHPGNPVFSRNVTSPLLSHHGSFSEPNKFWRIDSRSTVRV